MMKIIAMTADVTARAVEFRGTAKKKMAAMSADANLNMIEIWKDIPGFEGHYKVSTFGRVMSVKNGDTLLMKIRPHTGIRDGKRLVRYMIVELRMPGRRKKFFMHVLMAMMFIPNPESKPIVNHKDGNTFNFSLTNLEWATSQENQRHWRYRRSEPVLETNDIF